MLQSPAGITACCAACGGPTCSARESSTVNDWIERRLQELAQIFSVTVAAFAVLDDRLHVLVRLDPDVAKRWSNDDVVRRWARLSPPRDKYRQPTPVSDGWVKSQRKDSRGVATARERLQSLSWFMKCLKEPLSRLANREEQTRGAFFEGRFKSVAILDEEALIVTCAYIDMLPVATGIARTAEAGKHTSIRQRVKHVKAQGGARDLNAARRGSVSGSKATAGREEGLWLCPIEDRRRLDSSREGMVEGFSLGNYLLLLEYTGRLFREGEAVVSAESGRYPGTLGKQCGELAGTIGEAGRRPVAGPLLRRQPSPVEGSRRAPGRAPPGEPGRLRGAMKTS